MTPDTTPITPSITLEPRFLACLVAHWMDTTTDPIITKMRTEYNYRIQVDTEVPGQVHIEFFEIEEEAK